MSDIHDVHIEQTRGHWEVHVNGEFFCSADSYTEAINEFREAYKQSIYISKGSVTYDN